LNGFNAVIEAVPQFGDLLRRLCVEDHNSVAPAVRGPVRRLDCEKASVIGKVTGPCFLQGGVNEFGGRRYTVRIQRDEVEPVATFVDGVEGEAGAVAAYIEAAQRIWGQFGRQVFDRSTSERYADNVTQFAAFIVLQVVEVVTAGSQPSIRR